MLVLFVPLMVLSKLDTEQRVRTKIKNKKTIRPTTIQQLQREQRIVSRPSSRLSTIYFSNRSFDLYVPIEFDRFHIFRIDIVRQKVLVIKPLNVLFAADIFFVLFNFIAENFHREFKFFSSRSIRGSF